MQELKTISIKECKRCGAATYCEKKPTVLEYGDGVEIVTAVVVRCEQCPTQIGPR